MSGSIRAEELPMNVHGTALAWLWVPGMVFVGALSGVGAGQSNSDAWQIPTNAPSEQNPVVVTSDVLKKGQQIFKSRCEPCHGATGKGNGPFADKTHPPSDLTDPSRAGANPDGVMFYRIWNGRKNPTMPAFKTDLTRTEVWTVIHYAKTLRQ